MDEPKVETVEIEDARVPAGHREDHSAAAETSRGPAAEKSKRREIGGPQGPEPTRFGDWERAGRCVDF